ncbi:hypothetical protein BASA50_006399 [Batrachochytrium salamandrivorans]|uniref:RanBD1 domain-containing protein n=1 Tax=Batrachochytrium salamandrivorans TaxID=1357716 RepID=A0ABQ8FA28_9FUNG|nr:hypothetical protein BASA50_006399 [Batrachochytrium salamandrivorans]KAH9276648.1 hypothetical protein BASA83_000779 [Batrachochytrium salamandrivorans]
MSEAPMQEPFAALVSADAAPSSDKPISVAQDDASVSESISAATTTHVEPSAPVEDAEMILTPSSTLTEKRKRGTQESPAQKKLVLEADTGEAEAKCKNTQSSDGENSISTIAAELSGSPPKAVSNPPSPSRLVAEAGAQLEQQRIDSPSPESGSGTGTTHSTTIGIQQSSLGLFSSSTDKPAIPISSTHSLSTALLKTEEPSFGSFSAHESVGLTFGSAVSTSTSFASILAGSSSASSSAKLGSDTFARAGNSELKVDEEDHGSFTENAGHTFAEPMIVVTGEEDETTLHTARCKLYAWDGENWRERGAGSIKINESSGSKDSTLQRRLVMRADGVLRVILNVRILPSMPCHLRDDKYVEAVACEHPPTLTKFLFKFANNEVAASFLSSVEESLQSL